MEIIHDSDPDDYELDLSKYSTVTHDAQPALIAAYTILWVIGAVGNLWVAFIIGYLLTRRRSGPSPESAPMTVQIYIFSLCLCDLLVLLFLPFLLLDLIYGSFVIPSPLLCKIYLLSEGFNKFGAPWLLTALSGFCYSNINRMSKLESNRGQDTATSSLNSRRLSWMVDAQNRRLSAMSNRRLSAVSTSKIQNSVGIDLIQEVRRISRQLESNGGQDSIRSRQTNLSVDAANRRTSVISNRRSSATSNRSSSATSTVILNSRIRRPSTASKTPSAYSYNPIQKDNVRNAVITVILCLFAVVLAMTPVIVYAELVAIVFYQNETEIHAYTVKCAFRPPENILALFTGYSLVIGYICPAFLFTYFYSAILFYVRRHKRTLANASGLGTGRAERRYCRVTRTAIGLVGWTLAAWTPWWTIFLYIYFHSDNEKEITEISTTTVLLSYFIHMIPYVNCSAYPILYTILNKNIRTAYARAKMASMNKRRRRRLNIQTDANANNSSSGGGSTKMFRNLQEYSTCDAMLQDTNNTVRDYENASLTLADENQDAKKSIQS